MMDLDDPNYGWLCDQLGDLLPEVYDSPNPNDFIRSLEDWERNFYYISTALQYIINGGVDTYLEGPHGDEVEPLLDALEQIGAYGFRNRILSLKRLFPEGVVPVNMKKRHKCMDHIRETNCRGRISELLEGEIESNIFELIRKLENQKSPA